MKAPWLLLKWTTILLLLEAGASQPAPPEAGISIPRPEDSQSLSFPELDRAASDVIQRLKSIYPEGKVVVIGGAALQKYLPGYRSTRDVDIYQTMGNSGEIKKELLKDPRFYTRQAITDNIDLSTKENLFYRNANGKNIEIDLPGKHVLTFEPASAKVLRGIPAGSVPYISVDELIISKIESSRKRPEAAKKALDIDDAKELLEKYPETTFTTENHRQIAEKFRSEQKSPTPAEGGVERPEVCKRDIDCTTPKETQPENKGSEGTPEKALPEETFPKPSPDNKGSEGILEKTPLEGTPKPYSNEELSQISEKFAEEQFAALSVRYRLANVKTRQWSVSPLELRKRLQGYKRLRATTKFKPGKPVTLVGGGLAAGAAVVGFPLWVADVVGKFHAEVSHWDKAAALTAILPLVGCQVQAAAAEERGQLDSLDHGLCVFADGLMMTGVGLIPGLAVQAFRLIRNTLLGKQLPSANDLLRLRDQKWQDHLGSMNKSLFSEDFASLVEADFMIEMSTALFEATNALGRLQAGEQVALKAGSNTEQVQAIQAGMLEIRRQFVKGVNQRKAELRTNLPKRMKRDLEAQANNFNEKFIEALKGYNGYEKKEGGDWTPLVDLKQVESIVQELRRSPLQTPDLEIITTLVHQKLDPLAVPSLATEYQGDREIYHFGGPSDSGDRWQDSPWRDSSPSVSPGPLVTFCVDAARCVQVRIRFGTCDTFGFFDHDFNGTISSFSLDRSASTCRLYRDSNCAGLHLTTSHPYNELPSRGPEFGNVVNSFSCSSNEPPSANPPAERVKQGSIPTPVAKTEDEKLNQELVQFHQDKANGYSNDRITKCAKDKYNTTPEQPDFQKWARKCFKQQFQEWRVKQAQ